MTCSSCGAANAPGQKFCGECGSRLASGCPTCGATNPPGQKFCGECGTPLAGDAGRAAATRREAPAREVAGTALAGAAGPSAERRLVSVLFADLVGFTPFAEERDAEDVRDTLTRYFDLARGVILRYGGRVEKFIGDAVMAVWGTPVAREDDAERAVRAALELVDIVRTLAPGIQARAGVLTGEAAVDLAATDQGMVAGDLVNTAARLQSVAPHGAVLVGEATRRAAGGAIAFAEAGDHVLKGKAAPVPAWQALRVVANRGGKGRSDLPEPPFVGRDEELRVLKDLVTAQSRDPRVRVASVIAPGGFGKSRLAWELEKYIDGLVEAVYWHRGRSPSYGEGITFWALGEMVRQRCGLAESDSAEVTRERVAATVAEYVPAEDDRRWVEPALLALLGIEPAPAGGRERLFAGWRIFFERIAARGTAVLLFEDLQWADTGLLDFIDHLVEWARGVPILIVTLARPELFDRRPTWGAGTRHFTSLALEPLSASSMRQLLDGFVPGLPRDATEAILRRADGIPLYAVETVRALVAGGRLRELDGTYRPVGDLSELTVPETLQSLIASRLDALDPASRALVLDAAVLGQTFSTTALEAVSGQSADELAPRLKGLVRRELLEMRADPTSPERGQYAFVQSLIREVAYGSLARRERRARHLAVARHFEAIGDDEVAGALATHYFAAYRASAEGPEADAIAVQARRALRAAAQRATSLGAHDQALAFLRQAAEVTPDARDRAELLMLAAASADDGLQATAALDLGRQAREVYAGLGDAAGVGRADAALGRILVNDGQIAEAVEALQAALEAIGESGDETARAGILTNLSRALMRSGLSARAVETADRALAIAERLDLEEVLAEAFNNKAAGLSYLGRKREAIALMEAAVRVAEAGGYVNAELRARNNLSSVTWDRDPAAARQFARSAYDLARRLGNRGMANWALGTVATASYFAGQDWDWAIATIDEALAGPLGSADVGRLVSSRAFMDIARGDFTDASFRQLEEATAARSDPLAVATLHCIRGDRALMAGEYGSAYEEMVRAADLEALAGVYLSFAYRAALWAGDAARLREVLARLEALPDAHQPSSAADILEVQAGLASLERRPEALAAWRTVFGRYRDLGYDFEVARAVLDALRSLGPDEPELRRAAEEARAIFERVGARPYLALLDDALAHRSTANPSRVTRSVEATA